MRRQVSINTANQYNLGAAKLADWLRDEGWQVDAPTERIKTALERRARTSRDPGWLALGYDLVAISVIFSWDAPLAHDIALRVKDHAEGWCGGPGVFTLANWWHKETGLHLTKGLDSRFEHQRGKYKMAFASRGCTVGCSFCVVPKLEGSKQMTM